MKPNVHLLLPFLASALLAQAAPLTATTAVHTAPDESSLTITVLHAGAEPVAALSMAPAGWTAVELAGPFDVYIRNGDIMKSLDPKVGASAYLTPKVGQPELTKIELSDHTNITGLHGKFTRVSLEKKIVGYIHTAGPAAYQSPITATTMATTSTGAPAPQLMDAAPVTPIAYGVTTAGRPAPMVNLGDGGASTLPRLFQGKFVSTRSAFKPRRPYDWALNDDAGSRYAYVDISKLLLTDQIEKYVGHTVVVYGAAKSVPGGKDIVIEVDSLQLK
ncbi:MAG: hypothetical protein JWM32_3201 [Verrucomicrobia bacterium]|nr:hypothetical protein [Verrucomicrobiota bacterium]